MNLKPYTRHSNKTILILNELVQVGSELEHV